MSTLTVLSHSAQRRHQAAPISGQGIYLRAVTGQASPRQAIKAMYLECLGYERKEITNCTSRGCPLWSYRPYQDGPESLREAANENLSDENDLDDPEEG